MNELQQIRKRLGLTQVQMAAAIGMSFRGYQDAERLPRRIHLLAAKYVELELQKVAA